MDETLKVNLETWGAWKFEFVRHPGCNQVSLCLDVMGSFRTHRPLNVKFYAIGLAWLLDANIHCGSNEGDLLLVSVCSGTLVLMFLSFMAGTLFSLQSTCSICCHHCPGVEALCLLRYAALSFSERQYIAKTTPKWGHKMSGNCEMMVNASGIIQGAVETRCASVQRGVLLRTFWRANARTHSSQFLINLEVTARFSGTWEGTWGAPRQRANVAPKCSFTPQCAVAWCMRCHQWLQSFHLLSNAKNAIV